MRLKQLETLIESSKKHALFEGVKIGKKEIEETLNNSADFQMGIEYEFRLPQPMGNNEERLEKTKKFVSDNNIKHVDNIEREHDFMNEVITTVMPIPTGIKHIKDFFDTAVANGITFPETAGLHVSISHKHYDKKDINFAKFLVLLSGDYLHSIFPERKFVKNISDRMREALKGYKDPSIEEMEFAVSSVFEYGDEATTKYITAKISDYITMDGRIELRFVGGENHNERFNEIRWQVLRAVYILAIAYEPEMFKKEYLKTLYSYTQPKKLPKNYDLSEVSPELALELSNEYSDPRLIDIILTDSSASMKYASYVLNGRFKKGEPIIATDSWDSYLYARDVLKGRFKRGEPSILTSAHHSYVYAKDVIKGRFEEAEDIIKTGNYTSLRYAIDVLKDRFEKGEDAIATNAEASYTYAKEVIKDRFEKGEAVIAEHPHIGPKYEKEFIRSEQDEPPKNRKQTLDDILDDLLDSDLSDLY